MTELKEIGKIWDTLSHESKHDILKLDKNFKELFGTDFDIAYRSWRGIHKTNQRKIQKIMESLGLE